jgi:hypothetical protein
VTDLSRHLAELLDVRRPERQGRRGLDPLAFWLWLALVVALGVAASLAYRLVR